jgi:hypothetical protein
MTGTGGPTDDPRLSWQAVQDFWPRASLGLLRYDMSRTHSIMRVATTACPTGGSEVREQMIALEQWSRDLWAAKFIQKTWGRKARARGALKRRPPSRLAKGICFVRRSGCGRQLNGLKIETNFTGATLQPRRPRAAARRLTPPGRAASRRWSCTCGRRCARPRARSGRRRTCQRARRGGGAPCAAPWSRRPPRRTCWWTAEHPRLWGGLSRAT